MQWLQIPDSISDTFKVLANNSSEKYVVPPWFTRHDTKCPHVTAASLASTPFLNSSMLEVARNFSNFPGWTSSARTSTCIVFPSVSRTTCWMPPFCFKKDVMSPCSGLKTTSQLDHSERSCSKGQLWRHKRAWSRLIDPLSPTVRFDFINFFLKWRRDCYNWLSNGHNLIMILQPAKHWDLKFF